MNFQEIVIGETVFSSKIKALQTKEIQADSWMYLVAGIHGDEVEGIYVLTQFVEWLKSSSKNKLPLIIIPILNIDGYQAGTRHNARNVDLNRNFPVSSQRQLVLSLQQATEHKVLHDHALKEAESFYLKQFLDQYPPQFLLSFHATLNGKVICLGDTGNRIGQFICKYNHYELIQDQQVMPGTLEAFVFDFYLTPVVTLKVAKSTPLKGFKEIWGENFEALTSLLDGQAY